MTQDMKRRATEWQGKQHRLKRIVILSVIVVLAVLGGVVWNWLTDSVTDWLLASVIGVGGIGVFLFSLSAYTNTALVAMYYTACERLVSAPEELDLVTGTIQEVHRLKVPYIGNLYQITLLVAGEPMRFYIPGTLLRGVQPLERIRLFTHDLFAVRLESTGLVEAPAEPTKSA
ncbi:MAG TPA: hypothetical protein VFV52_11470 [Bacilli bacterium]|nr:hypothetical protein [Bacilli bacterium]